MYASFTGVIVPLSLAGSSFVSTQQYSIVTAPYLGTTASVGEQRIFTGKGSDNVSIDNLPVLYKV